MTLHRRILHMFLIVGIALFIAGCATKSATTRAHVPDPPPFKTPHLPAVDCDAVVLPTDSDLAFCEGAGAL